MFETRFSRATIVSAQAAERIVDSIPDSWQRFMQKTFASTICTLLLLIGVSASQAQTITTGVIHGIVRDDALSTLGDVSVTLTANDGGGVRSYTTSRSGDYRFALLAPGTYTLLLERLGYRPVRIERVQIRAGSDVNLNADLKTAPPPVGAPEVVQFVGETIGSRAGISQWLTTVPVQRFPAARRELNDLAALASTSTPTLEVEGLPSSFSTYYLDGVRYSPARHSGLGQERALAVALPLNSVQFAELITSDPDLEWSGFAGGALSAQTRRGNARFTSQSFGSWSNGPLQSSKFFDAGDLSTNSIWGGLLLSGPIIPDTAHYVLGVEARRLDTPLPKPWEMDDQIDAALVRVARDSFGVQLEDYTRPFAVRTAVLSAFGRFDWQLGNDNSISVRFGAGNIARPTTDTDVPASAAPEALAQGSDLLFTAALASKIRTTWDHEIRIGIGRSTRDYSAEAVDAANADLPETVIVAGGNRFGIDPRIPAQFNRTDFTTIQSLVIPRSSYRLKFGLETVITAHNDEYAYARNGEFVFGGPAEFERGRGAFLQSVGPLPTAKFTAGRYGVFAQANWQAAPGLKVVAGGRVDLQQLPWKAIRFDKSWFDLTGIANDSIPKSLVSVDPRLGVTWDVTGEGLWIVRATAGLYSETVDPSSTGEILANDGTLAIRRSTGNLGSWPDLASAAGGIASNPALSILGRDFRAPRTTRASFGLSHRMGAAVLHLSGAYRSTDFLTRHADLNLLDTPTAHDQSGRPIFGALTQSGQLIASLPNRRFSTFDQVSALSTDGWSHYLGVSALLEQNVSDALRFFAHYTYSRTTDNWLGAISGTITDQFTPFPDAPNDNWREGVSDFDLTHKATAGFELLSRGSLQPHVTALYRYRTGYPFTPGFRDGVDVNGDGSGNNDPAFVDEAIAGVTDLMGSWNCLRNQSGQFAERNSCRQPAVHSLDVRLGLSVSRSSAFSAEIFADGINLIESEQGIPDRALYLIDANRTITQSGGTLSLPLVANPHFGKPLTRVGSGRMFRIGLQVNH
jgi:hypothetical protein